MYDFLDKIGLKAVLEAIKGKMPTSLPANGGNADTVDGYHVADGIHGDISIPPIYFTEFLRINDDTKSIERWITDNLKVAFANNAANADTVDGLHANDFTQIIDFGDSETDTKTAIGQPGKTTIYRCYFWTDYPIASPDGQGVIITVNYNGSGTAGTDFMWVVQLFISARTSNIYKRFINGLTIDNWEEIYTTRNKSYVTGSATVEANSNVCVTNHGFMPSAVIWWESSVFSGVATSFDDTKFIIGALSNMDRTINYLIFK